MKLVAKNKVHDQTKSLQFGNFQTKMTPTGPNGDVNTVSSMQIINEK